MWTLALTKAVKAYQVCRINHPRTIRTLLKVAFFQKVWFIFQISKSPEKKYSKKLSWAWNLNFPPITLYSLLWVEMKCTVHVVLPKTDHKPVYTPVQQIRQQYLRVYCPNKYILCKTKRSFILNFNDCTFADDLTHNDLTEKEEAILPAELFREKIIPILINIFHGQTHHIFSRFLNLRIFFSKFFFVSFWDQIKLFIITEKDKTFREKKFVDSGFVKNMWWTRY